MITYMKSIQSTTYLFYSFGSFVLKNNYAFPPPPPKFKTAAQLATQDFIQQGILKSKAKKQANTHPKFEEFEKQSKQDKETYYKQLEEYKAKYKNLVASPQALTVSYLYNKYKDHPFKPKTRIEYPKILDTLSPEQKEADLKEIEKIYKKRKEQVEAHNQELNEKYLVPKKLAFYTFVCSKKKIIPIEQKEKIKLISAEELEQLKVDYQKELELTEARYQKIADLYGLTVQEFKEELLLQKRLARQDKKKKQKQQKKEDSSSSSDAEDAKKEKEEKKN